MIKIYQLGNFLMINLISRNESIINFIVTTPEPVFWKGICTGELWFQSDYKVTENNKFYYTIYIMYKIKILYLNKVLD